MKSVPRNKSSQDKIYSPSWADLGESFGIFVWGKLCWQSSGILSQILHFLPALTTSQNPVPAGSATGAESFPLRHLWGCAEVRWCWPEFCLTNLTIYNMENAPSPVFWEAQCPGMSQPLAIKDLESLWDVQTVQPHPSPTRSSKGGSSGPKQQYLDNFFLQTEFI